MQEPFCSVPLIWIIQEDTLASRLQLYEDMSWGHLISDWKIAFSRADLVVFPEFSFPVIFILDFSLRCNLFKDCLSSECLLFLFV